MGGAGSQGSRRGPDLLIGFVAGVLSVAVFHQGTVFVLGLAGLGEGAIYSFRPTPPFGVPRVMSLMFWGGVWGVVLALLVDRLPARWPLVVTGFLFALLGPVLFGWTAVAAVRGVPLFAGFNPTRILTSVLINGAYGIGAVLILAWLRRSTQGRAA